MKIFIALTALLGLGSACNFDEAFRRYCDQNPKCLADAGIDVQASSNAIPPPRYCGRGNTCTPGWTCHPSLEICIQLCTTSADCPSWNYHCTPVFDRGVILLSVCQCSDTSCQSANINFTCSLVDLMCERQCATSQDCESFRPPRVCDTFAGFCVPSQVTCRTDIDCANPARPRCDMATFRCVP